uniref:PHD-type domain-containing protein n=1 Tax=Rhodnius prolixus TaxID=13249 RepID=T1IDC2_RHOPR
MGKKPALAICGECLGTAAKNKHGQEEALLSCETCGCSVHPSCVSKPDILTNLIAKGNIWNCEECVQCDNCHLTNDKVFTEFQKKNDHLGFFFVHPLHYSSLFRQCD